MTNSLWFQVEQDIAKLLIDKLENGQLDPKRAVDIARFITHQIPHQLTDQQMQAIIPSLNDQFYELASIVHHHLAKQDEKLRAQQIPHIKNQLSTYLHQKHVSLS